MRITELCDAIGQIGRILEMMRDDKAKKEYQMLRYFLEMSLEDLSVKFYIETGEWFGNIRHIAGIDRDKARGQLSSGGKSLVRPASGGTG